MSLNKIASGKFDAAVRALKKGARPKLQKMTGDGGGLFLQCHSKNGGLSWLFRYKYENTEKYMGLGPAIEIGLAEAREIAAGLRGKLARGMDPKAERDEAKRAARAKAAKSVTFKEAAEALIEMKKPEWQNAKHADQWTNTLTEYVYPTLGSLQVGDIDTGLVLKCLKPIWHGKTETASRVRQRIEAVLNSVYVTLPNPPPNPARWKGHLENLLPKRSKVAPVENHRAMPYSEVPAFVAELRRKKGSSARALLWCILNASRTGEVVGADYREIQGNIWIIPASRMKAKKEHRVPLSTAASELLDKNGSGLLFPNAEGVELSSNALLKLLADMGRDCTTHGFRSSFKDWATERTSYPDEISELALAHVTSDKARAAYARTDALEKRRRLMADWARYCLGGTVIKGSNVVAIKGQRRGK